MPHIPVMGVTAHGSNQGKTRLLLALLPELTGRGLKVAVLKHAQHVHLPPNKDSSLFMQAGAASCMTVSPEGWLMSASPDQEPDFHTALKQLSHSGNFDLLLTEGYKKGPQKKLLLTTKTLAETELLPHTVALISEAEQILPLPCFHPDNIPEIADFIIGGFYHERYQQA